MPVLPRFFFSSICLYLLPLACGNPKLVTPAAEDLMQMPGVTEVVQISVQQLRRRTTWGVTLGGNLPLYYFVFVGMFDVWYRPRSDVHFADVVYDGACACSLRRVVLLSARMSAPSIVIRQKHSVFSGRGQYFCIVIILISHRYRHYGDRYIIVVIITTIVDLVDPFDFIGHCYISPPSFLKVSSLAAPVVLTSWSTRMVDVH